MRAISKLLFSVAVLVWLSLGASTVHADLPDCYYNNPGNQQPSSCCWAFSSGFSCDEYCDHNDLGSGSTGDECEQSDSDPGLSCQCEGPDID